MRKQKGPGVARGHRARGSSARPRPRDGRKAKAPGPPRGLQPPKPLLATPHATGGAVPSASGAGGPRGPALRPHARAGATTATGEPRASPKPIPDPRGRIAVGELPGFPLAEITCCFFFFLFLTFISTKRSVYAAGWRLNNNNINAKYCRIQLTLLAG